MSPAAADAVPAARIPARVRAANARRSSVSVRELLACALGLGLLALVMCATHIRSGGSYYDDWSLLALARFPAPGGLLHVLWLDYGQRPGQVLYYAALEEVLGVDSSARLAIAAATLVLEAVCLYALLRQLGLAVRHALAIAALLLTFPFSDSVWLWGVLSLSSLAIAACLLGVILALRALASPAPRALALHLASLSLYLVSVLSYEVCAVACCLAGLLYVRAVGLSRARARWALDVCAIAATLAVARGVLPIDVATPSRTQSLTGVIGHAGLIASRGVGLAGAAALPLGGVSPWIGAGLLGAVLLAATALRLRLSAGEQVRADLGRWLAIAGAGTLVAIASWAVYVPGPDHYAPTLDGTVNRMNAAAAVGVVIVVYAAVMLLACMLARLLGSSARVVAPGSLSLALALALGGAYLGRTAADVRVWDAAAADQQRVLADVRAALPRLPGGATVYAFDAPRTVGQGVPVLSTTLDLTSAMRLSYASPQLVGVALAGSAGLTCGPHGPLAGGVGGDYGRSYLLDVRARRAVRLGARAQCTAQSRRASAGAGRPAGRS